MNFPPNATMDITKMMEKHHPFLSKQEKETSTNVDYSKQLNTINNNIMKNNTILLQILKKMEETERVLESRIINSKYHLN